MFLPNSCRSLLTTALLVVLGCFQIKAQTQKPWVDPLKLLDDAIDQEGFFFLPGMQESPADVGNRAALEKTMQNASKSGDRIVMAQSAIQLSWFDFYAGNTKSSIDLTKTALESLRDQEEPSLLLLVELQLSWFHLKNGNVKEAMSLADKVSIDATKLKSLTVRATAQVVSGQAAMVTSDWTKAHIHYLNASKILGLLANRLMEGRCLVQAAEALIRKGDTPERETLLKNAYNLFALAKNSQGMALVHRDLGIILFKKGLYERANAEFIKSLESDPQVSTSRLLKDSYLKLSTLLTLAGDHKTADSAKINYEQLRDSIDGIESSRTMNSRLTRRDLAERAAINDMLRKDINFTMSGLSANDLERNRLLIDAEIERLEKEKLIEELGVEKRKSDVTNQERDEKIKELLREKQSQELALSKKELQVSRGQAFRNLLIAVAVSIIIISLLVYNRYRHEKRIRKDLDVTYHELSQTHTKLLSTQEQLVHSQKMASLGQLTAGIAHEIQNPLNFVNNFSELSLDLIEEMKTATEKEKEALMHDVISNLKKINEHGKRADRIVKGMLTHSRIGKPEKQSVDLNRMIEELLELSYHGNRSRDTGFKSEILKNLDPNMPMVHVVMQEISRVFVNIFNNAFYAVFQRSRAGEKNYHASVGVSTRLENDRVVIKIRDNGVGMPEEVKQKIFDPFFTTKPTGEGTGLGLSLSYDIIVKAHQGTLQVNSEPNAFTEFVITLPIK